MRRTGQSWKRDGSWSAWSLALLMLLIAGSACTAEQSPATGTPANAGTSCAAGGCACLSGFTDCGAGCVDTRSDFAHCGSCNTACVSPQVCSVGQCSSSCGAGLTLCGQSCVDLQASPAHCGQCGTTCPDGVCTAGACAPAAAGQPATTAGDSTPPAQPAAPTVTCEAGLTACGGNCVDPLTDAAHCGKCYVACAAGSCNSGVCPTVKDCFVSTQLSAAPFSDFENYDEAVTADKWQFSFNTPKTVYAGPFFYDDNTGTPVHAMVPGANNSKYAMSTSNVEATDYGGGMGFWFGCIDATAYEGVSLWVRGDAPNGIVAMSVAMEETTAPDKDDPAGGGTCELAKEGDCTPGGFEIPVTETWTKLMIPWASFVGGTAAAGAPVPVDGHNLTGLSFHVPLKYVASDPNNADSEYVPRPGPYRLEVDDFQFIEPGSCTAGEVLCDIGCVNFQTNKDHCGSCGNACDASRICSGGECVCPPGQTDCDGRCADLQTDPQDCGSCGTQCGGQCSAGACAPSACGAASAKVTEACARGDVIAVGKYRVFNNWWGADGANGSQCIWDTCTSGNTVGWGTEWQWGGGSPFQVKSFDAIVLGWHWGWGEVYTGLPIQLSEKRDVECKWTYKVNASGTFNVAFDMFTSDDPMGAGNPTEEIMVLLRDVEGSQGGLGNKVADVTFGGTSYGLWKGTNNVWDVYQFVRTTPSPTGDTLDMKAFLDDLVTRKLVPGDRHLLSIEAGSEVFDGQGRIDTSEFYCTIQ